jgi:Tfp pilus assembly major pilin PilA
MISNLIKLSIVAGVVAVVVVALPDVKRYLKLRAM